MKSLYLRTFLLFLISQTNFFCAAEESAQPPLTSLTSTTISGYVDATGAFANTNAFADGFSGTWLGIIKQRASTNRLEFYVLVDENGNFAGRTMNFDRTLGSDQLDGTLNKNGKVKIGQTRFHFRRSGTGTIIGRGENGRLFTGRLFREQVR